LLHFIYLQPPYHAMNDTEIQDIDNVSDISSSSESNDGSDFDIEAPGRRDLISSGGGNNILIGDRYATQSLKQSSSLSSSKRNVRVRSNNTWADKVSSFSSLRSGPRLHTHTSSSAAAGQSSVDLSGMINSLDRSHTSRLPPGMLGVAVGSDFSPISYQQYDGDQQKMKSLERLQNEALGSWLRLRPRESSISSQSSHTPVNSRNSVYPSSFPIIEENVQTYGNLCPDKAGKDHLLIIEESVRSEMSKDRRSQTSRSNEISKDGRRQTTRSNELSKDRRSQTSSLVSDRNGLKEYSQSPLDFTSAEVCSNNSVQANDEKNINHRLDLTEVKLHHGTYDMEKSEVEDRKVDGDVSNNYEQLVDQCPEGHENENTATDSSQHWASPDSKYERYACRIDREQGDRALEITIFTCKRPHMRSFHMAWFSFFVAFFLWFAISPLLKEIKDSLGLTNEQVWTSNTFSSLGTIFYRLIVGPLCDQYGSRIVMSLSLVLTALPVMATGLVHNATELYIVRLLSGIGGSTFVTCQYWTSSIFVREIAGTANSIASGWGNLGGGVAQVFMGSILFPLFKLMYGEENSSLAWRSIFVVPASFAILTAVFVMKYSDDTPKGNFRKLNHLGMLKETNIRTSFRRAASSINTWILFAQYACCFGVEVTMTTGAAYYFSDVFGQSTESAAALASIFGWLNLFARGLGGFISDIMNVKYGMRGRLIWQVISLILEGILIICFGYSRTLGGAICSMIFFSLFVQTSEGSTYSIVPYVCPRATGSVAGIVGAGGNVGGVLFLYLITLLGEYKQAFLYMGVAVICSSVLTLFINIQGFSRLLSGKEELKEKRYQNNMDRDAIQRDEEGKATEEIEREEDPDD